MFDSGDRRACLRILVLCVPPWHLFYCAGRMFVFCCDMGGVGTE